MPKKNHQRRTAGPGRPRKYGEDLKKFQAPVPESTHARLYALKEKLGVPFSELLTWLVDVAEGKMDELELKARDRHQRERIRQLEKSMEVLLRERDKLLEERERARLLREENRQLRAELLELKKQLKMSARDRKAEGFKREVREVIERYGKNGSIKLLELLKRLGYSGDFKRHAREFLGEWFVDEGRVLVSEDLGLVVEKVHGFGELAWVVRLDSFRFAKTKTKTKTGEGVIGDGVVF